MLITDFGERCGKSLLCRLLDTSYKRKGINLLWGEDVTTRKNIIIIFNLKGCFMHHIKSTVFTCLRNIIKTKLTHFWVP